MGVGAAKWQTHSRWTTLANTSDVQKDAQCNREFQALRTEGVPTFLIYGKDVQQGFRKDALYKALIRKRQD